MKEDPHPLIVKVIDDFIDDVGHICIVKEMFREGDFDRFLFRMQNK